MTAPDPLWDPSVEDDEVRALEAALRPLAVRGRVLPPRRAARRPRRAWAVAAVAAAFCAATLAGALQYRLAWQTGKPWSVATPGGRTTLHVDQSISASSGASTWLQVARIGEIRLSPRSRMRLLETRRGQHVVRLDEGHLRARIWAPAGYFAADVGAARIVDLGCEFDLWRSRDGVGRVLVRSGWVSYRNGSQESLVPAGYQLRFDDAGMGTPLRPGASAALGSAVVRLERALRDRSRDSELQAFGSEVAQHATTADAFTLLSLLTQHPSLADTEIYPALARLFGEPALPQHRKSWRTGDQRAMNTWWRHMPAQPKQWWRNWRDALG